MSTFVPKAPVSPASRAASGGGEDLAPADYAYLTDLLFKESGLALGPEKGYLVRSRLAGPIAVAWGGGTLRGLIAALRTEQVRTRGARAATRAVCDAMTTNETLFFRDAHPFDALRDVVLPAAAARRLSVPGPPRPIRVWSAASSTGQEPYSIAICAALAAPRLNGAPVEILATDYSPTVLDRARDGTYSDFEVRRGLTPANATRFFTPTPTGGLRATDGIRRMIRFEPRNLLEPFTGMGTFDVIFCRNVLLYFDAATKRDVLDRMADVLSPGGLLVVGGTETPLGITSRFVRAAAIPTPAWAPVPGAVGVR